jgi:hypothetical protein
MAYVCRDFECLNPKCQHTWDDMVDRTEENDQKCPVCGVDARWVISPCNLATYSLMSRDDQAKHLRKRSRDHTRKELKKDPTSMKMSRHIKVGNKK